MTKTSDYQVRLLELTYFRKTYIPLIYDFLLKWNNNHVPWVEDPEQAFEWIVNEAIFRITNVKILNHYHSDLGKHIYNTFPSILLDIESVTGEIAYFTKGQPFRHMKTLVVGNILVLAILY